MYLFYLSIQIYKPSFQGVTKRENSIVSQVRVSVLHLNDLHFTAEFHLTTPQINIL